MADQQIVPVSSSLIRRLIAAGRVRDAATLLGRPYELCCEVGRGDQRGRDLDMPTANLDAGDYLLPADGIYAGLGTAPDGKTYPAAISVGDKPTFEEGMRTCEAHLIGFEGPIDDYGWALTLRFTDWIRDQIAFDGVEGLMEQMQRDLRSVQRAVGRPMSAVV